MIGEAGLALLGVLLAATFPSTQPAAHLRSDHTTSYYHYILGSIAEAENDYAHASEEYKKALDATPGSSDIRAARARALMRENNLDEMKREIEAILAADPNNVDANELLGMYYYSQKEQTAGTSALAREALERAVAGGTTNSRTYYLLAQLYIEAGADKVENKQRALDALERFTAEEPEDFDGHYRKGLVLELLGRDADAESSFKRALDIAPGFSPAYRELLALYARTNRMDELRSSYKKMLAAHPDDYRVRAGLAASLFEKELYAEAGEVLEYDRYAPSYSPAVRTLAARIYGRLNRPSKVIEILKGQASDPEAPLDALFELGRAYEDREEFAQAVSVFEAMVKRSDPSTLPALLFHLGFARHEMKDYPAALQAYADGLKAATAAKDEEMTKTIYRYLVLCRAQSGDAAGARKLLQEANQAFPGAHELQNLGLDLDWAIGAKQPTLDALKELARQDHASWEIRITLARKQFELKRYKDMASTLKEAAGSDTAPEEALYLLGAAYERAGDLKRARQVLTRGISRFPQNADMMNYLGYSLIEKGIDLKDAVQMVEKAVSIEPENEAFLDSLAWGEFKLGRLGSARQHIDLSMKYGQPNWEILEHAGEIYCALDLKPQANEFFEKAMKISPADTDKVRTKLEECGGR